jgi:hypothetical protein
MHRGLAFVFFVIAGLSQSTAFRAHRSEKVEAAEDFVPLAGQTRAAVDNKKHIDAAAPQVGTFRVGDKFTSYRHALASVRLNAADGGAEGASTDGMKEVATAAMDSGGDPAKVAAAMEGLSEADKQAVANIKVDVVAKAKEMAGVTGPLGFFDPAGYCAECSEGKLCFYREVEVKHGRVGMLASLGFVVGENFHPLFGGDIDVPSYIAFQQTPLQTFWPVVVALLAIPEVYSVFSFNEPWKGDNELWTVKTDRIAGDLGFDPLGLKPKNEKDFKTMQNKELNNGRLAMLAASGMIAQELVTGEKLVWVPH